MIKIHKCLKCRHEWPSKQAIPLRCARCNSINWNKSHIGPESKEFVDILPGEKFVFIKGFGNLYKISNMGRVFSIKNNRILRPTRNPSGNLYMYLPVVGIKNGKMCTIRKPKELGYLVAMAFLRGQHSNEIKVTHIDGNPANNSIQNLKWL